MSGRVPPGGGRTAWLVMQTSGTGPAEPSASWQAGSGCQMGSAWVAGGLGLKGSCYGLEAPSAFQGQGVLGSTRHAEGSLVFRDGSVGLHYGWGGGTPDLGVTREVWGGNLSGSSLVRRRRDGSTLAVGEA